MKKIAVLTSGGDAPGMNAAIRGVVRTALYEDMEIIGFHRGYAGLLNKEYHQMDVSSVGGILEEGGTVLRTFRCPEFKEREAQVQAAQNLNKLGIEGLVVIGGEGSLRGALALDKIWSGDVVGIPGSIDNDVRGTDLCLGFDTAVNTALESVDRIRDTATSHERLFIIEVMGRNSGHIALSVGLAGGAEEILIPEREYSVDEIGERIQEGWNKGKLHYIIVLAEGAGKSFQLAQRLKKISGMEIRVAVLGHIQRGGAPTAWDRILGGKMGYFAVRALIEGSSGVCVGVRSGRRNLVPFAEAVGAKKLSPENERIAKVFAT
ncbi:MAG: 6-phosphofructokinase [bacterium]